MTVCSFSIGDFRSICHYIYLAILVVAPANRRCLIYGDVCVPLSIDFRFTGWPKQVTGSRLTSPTVTRTWAKVRFKVKYLVGMLKVIRIFDLIGWLCRKTSKFNWWKFNKCQLFTLSELRGCYGGSMRKVVTKCNWVPCIKRGKNLLESERSQVDPETHFPCRNLITSLIF